MRVFLTGATGFLGAHTLRILLERGHLVAALIRPGSDSWRLDGFAGDFLQVSGTLDPDCDLQSALGSFAPEAVLHLAWDGVAGATRDDPIQDRNVARTAASALLAADCGASTWIGVGSQAEYGPSSAIIDETHPCSPTTRYGQAKREAYAQAATICARAGVRCAWLRLFSSYGPMDHAHWMIPYLILQLLGRRRPALTGCEQKWDYLHGRDAARAIVATAEAPRAEGVFNLGSGQAYSLRGVVETIRDLIDPELPLGFGEVPYRSDQVMHLEAAIARLTEKTGWRPMIALDDGLDETVRWYREHRARFD